MSLALTETSIVSATLFACCHVYGYIFSSDTEVVKYVTVLALLVSISVILDSIQGVFTGKLLSIQGFYVVCSDST
ncbi:hypothetical protein MtrunA17_Chr7g0215591 [Medicago truncatula]|uniref:Transmembrane protein n=1 Tax=Medicago truncatula TaxID=3880 RepID=A0A396GSJ9_MEDTR|nr:hypothetical protein MtrunA17_Chr7g0215591 [Medicago truncatula]